MPEGPELNLSAQFINQVCNGRIFTGKILKSAVSRQPEIEWDEKSYTISASSRGKELKMTLSSVTNNDLDVTKSKKKCGLEASKTLDIVFQFGMSGKFDFYDASELQKHAHLNFFTKTSLKGECQMVLSFVDYRRFGKWQPGGDWSVERGPCVLTEYLPFRENVLKSLELPAFNKSICEVLLNQKYFNGVGNYLRAEICYRAGIPPFQDARSVLEPLVNQERQVKSENPDVLQLCHLLANQVINLGGTGYDPENRDPDYSKFTEWLQCYYKPGMSNIADHNGRTMWYSGKLGPMAPKDKKERNVKRRKKKNEDKGETKKMKVESEGDAMEVQTKTQRTKGKSIPGPITRQDVVEVSQAKKLRKNKPAAKQKVVKKTKTDNTSSLSELETSGQRPSESMTPRTTRKRPNKRSTLKARSKQRAASQTERATRSRAR